MTNEKPSPVVFPAEDVLGLTEAVKSQRTVAYLSEVKPGTVPTHCQPPGCSKASSRDQPDLFYLEAILVSTGWNNNHDVFGCKDTWAARHTPEDKPFNYEHKCDDIIGHVTASRAVDDAWADLDQSLTVESLPAKFHVLTGAVLYKLWDDEALQARMDQILLEVGQGQWFVSMECVFGGFDFAMIDLKTGQERVVARNKETAFLTKHLRAYGGDGTYQHFKIGRLLRDFTFTGKGLVRRPANPESVIFGPTRSFACGLKPGVNLEMTNPVGEVTPKERTMADEALTKQLEDAKGEIAVLKASLKDLADVNKRLKEQEDALSEQKNLFVKTQALLKEAEAKRDELAKEVQALTAERTLASRTEEARSKLDLANDQAALLAKSSMAQSDEAWKSQLEVMATAIAAKLPEKSTPAPAPASPPYRPVKTKAQEALEGVTPAPGQVALANEPESLNDEEEELCRSMAVYFGVEDK